MSNSLRLPREIHFRSENEHGTCTRALSRKRENRDPHFMRACAVEMDMRNSKSNFCASRPTQHAGATRANPDLNPLNSYRKNPLVRSTIWGTKLTKLTNQSFCPLLSPSGDPTLLSKAGGEDTSSRLGLVRVVSLLLLLLLLPTFYHGSVVGRLEQTRTTVSRTSKRFP